jgi:tryptophanyl-tRNA synthetase
MRAVTDSGPTATGMVQQKPEVIENLFSLVKIISGDEAFEYYNDLYDNMKIRYGDMKKHLAEDTIKFVAPFRKRITELLADTTLLDTILADGAAHAHKSASKTISEVRDIIGF